MAIILPVSRPCIDPSLSLETDVYEERKLSKEKDAFHFVLHSSPSDLSLKFFHSKYKIYYRILRLRKKREREGEMERCQRAGNRCLVRVMRSARVYPEIDRRY